MAYVVIMIGSLYLIAVVAQMLGCAAALRNADANVVYRPGCPKAGLLETAENGR